VPLRNLLMLLIISVVSYSCYLRAEQNPYARYVAGGFSIIDRWSLWAPDNQELFEGAMSGMMEVLQRHGDDHSMFVEQSQSVIFREELTQEFGGVGVRILQLGDPPQLTVVGPPEPSTPAYSSDIRSGDRIVAIDGQETKDMPMPQVLRLMRGPVGKPVVLTVLHAGDDEPTEISLVRATITMESILGDIRDEQNNWQYLLDVDSRIGYLRITNFGDKTEAELSRVLAQIMNDGCEALILDVRDNYGGALNAAVGISDLFLRAGLVIVTTRGRDEVVRDRHVATGRGGFTEMPLAVLTNRNSASASEILAAALQDYNRAVVVGERTYGKGTVQQLMRLESGRSLLKLTSATYWRPSEQNIHRMKDDSEDDPWGVKPNPGFAVEQDEEEYLWWRKYRHRRDLVGVRGEDPLFDQLEERDGKIPPDFADEALNLAVEYLQEKLASGNTNNR